MGTLGNWRCWTEGQQPKLFRCGCCGDEREKGGDGSVALDGSPGGPSLHQRLCHPERGEVPEKAWHHSRVGGQRELLRRSHAEQQLESTARRLPPRLLVPESSPDLSEHACDPREDSLRVKIHQGAEHERHKLYTKRFFLNHLYNSFS